MAEEYRVEPVTALFADGDDAQRNAIRLYAGAQDAVKICAMAQTGQQVLDLLRDGMEPRVLVLDTLIQNPGIFSLLYQISQLSFTYTPNILLTSVNGTAQSSQKLLTLGVDYIIFKPYTMRELFETVFQWGTGPANFDVYRVRELLNLYLDQLQVSRGMQGVSYLQQILCREVLTEGGYSNEELCHYVAQNQHLSYSAVISALRRLNDAMARGGSDFYRKMCIVNGKSENGRISERELICTLAERIRHAMHR